MPLTKVLGRGVAVERVRAGEAVRVTSEKTVRVGEGGRWSTMNSSSPSGANIRAD